MTGRILVVDDDKDVRDTLSLALQHQGYEVCTAADGMTGIRKAAEQHPDLIILDIMMPRISGYDTCRALRGSAEFKEVPILFLSARHSQVHVEKAMQNGGDRFIGKPYQIGEILEAVRQMLTKRGLNPHHDKVTANGKVHWVD